MGSRWTAPAVAGVVAAVVLGGALPAHATAPQVSVTCTTVTVTPTVHADETVDIFVDGVLVGDDVETGVPHTFPASAPQVTVKVAYENGSWSGPASYAVPVCEQAESTIEAAPSTVPPTTVVVATSSPTTAVPDQSTSAAPSPTVPGSTGPELTVATTAAPEVDQGVVTQCQTVTDPDTGEVVCATLPATGKASGAVLLIASLFAMAGMGLLIVRRRPAGN